MDLHGTHAASLTPLRLCRLPLRWRPAIFLVCGLAILWFGLLELRGLFQPDEGRYAEIPLAMLNSGDWITPRLNGLKYFEKPPLQYWITAAIYALFGHDEWTARLWPALAGFLGIGMVAFTGARLSPTTPPVVAASILVSCCGYFIGSQVLTLDMGLTFFLTSALCAFLLAEHSAATSLAKRGWMLASWAAIAFGVLSKGLVALLLPAMTIGAYVFLQRDWRLLSRVQSIPGLVLLLAITAPWFVLVQHSNPEFFQFFFVHEHLQRFALPHHHRPGPWWYFVPIVLLATLPWSPLLPAAIAQGWRRPAEAGMHVDRLLIIWSVVIVAFFSASSSKLPAYVLPAVPALALLIARNARWSDARIRLTGPITMTIAGAASATALVMAARAGSLGSYNAPDLAVVAWLVPFGWVLALAGLVASMFMLRGRLADGMVASAVGTLLALQVIQYGLHTLDERYSSERLVDSILGEKRTLAASVAVYSVKTFDDSVPFYLGRPVTLVSHKGELGPGIAAEPEKFIPTITEFIERWQEEGQAYALMTPAMHDELTKLGMPMWLVASDSRRVVVSRHP